MPSKKSAKSKKSFTEEQIRARAYQIWEKNQDQSEEENWNTAIKSLERERKFRVLINIWQWTGLREKKGWDIMTGLSIPLIVFGGGVLFNYLNNQQQQKIAEQNQKDELLKNYINDIKGFLLDKDYPLKNLDKDSVRTSIARTITLTTLTQLNSSKDEQRSKDGEYNQRKGLIIQFLFESGLINGDLKGTSIVSLNGADFSFADFSGSNLSGANLEFANLERANLIKTYLFSTNLGGANLIDADLLGADLMDANLSNANLLRVNLSDANLSDANLISTYLLEANLRDTKLNRTNLSNANLSLVVNLTNSQIKTACYWKQAIYTEAQWNQNKGFWIAKNKTANQKKIDAINQDKASDPINPPDCSKWKYQ